MSRLNRRPTTNIEEPTPVAVTRAKRLRQPTAPQPAIKPSYPAGIFYQQEVASYRLPRSLWQSSAAGPKSDRQQFALGKQMASAIDDYLHGAHTQVQTALGQLKNAASKIAKLTEEDSPFFKGYKEGLKDNPNITYKLWGGLIMGNGGIMENLNELNAELKPINVFMAEHSDSAWNVQIARFLEIEKDEGQEIQEKLVHLKKQQSNALLLSTTNREFSNSIKASEDADNEALAEQKLRDQEFKDLIKKQQKELNALLTKHNDASTRKTEEIIAKREEIKLDAMKAMKMVRKSVREDKKAVARGVTEFTNTIVKSDDENDDSD